MTDLIALNDLEPLERAHHDAETITAGLLELALCAGNATEAQRRLKSRGVTAGITTIKEWAEKYPQRYRHAQNTQAPLIEAEVIRQARETVLEMGRVMRKAVDKAEQQIDSGDVKDAAKAAQHLSIARKNTIDNMLLLDGRPTAITQSDRTPEEIIDGIFKKLSAYREQHAIDSTAVEEPATEDNA